MRLLDFEQVDYNRREGFNATFFNGRLLELVPKYKGEIRRGRERAKKREKKTQPSLSLFPPQTNSRKLHAGGGTFSLLYVNCEAAYAVASFQARASLYSVLPDGGRDFLPAGLGPLEGVYGCAAASAAAIFALWAWNCVSGRRYLSFSFGAAPAAALGAGLLAALTGLSFFAARGAAAAVRARGQAPAWAAASAGLELARVASLFGMLLLAGRGVGWGACGGGGGGGGGGGRGGAGLAALFAAASRRTCAGSPSCGVPAVPALLSSPRDARIVSVVLPLQIAVELALALVRGAASPAAPAADGSGGVGLSLSALLSLSGSSASASVPSSSSLAAFGAPGTRARDALYLAAAAGAVAVLAQVGWSERRAASRVAAGSSLSPASRGGGSASASAFITNDAKAGRAAASGALWRRWYTCTLLGVYGGRAAAALAAAVVPQPRGAWAPAAVGAAASLALALSAVLECCPGPTCEYGLLTLGLGNAASASASGRQAGNGREAEMSLRAGGGRMS